MPPFAALLVLSTLSMLLLRWQPAALLPSAKFVLHHLTTAPAANFGTSGSARGFTFDVVHSINVNLVVDAVYRNEVSVGANPFVGDPYTTLEINFAGFGLSVNMQFGADTDFIAAGAVIGPSVPKSASVVLMAAGVALLGLRRFRLPQAG